jgi:hypothetical protein
MSMNQSPTQWCLLSHLLSAWLAALDKLYLTTPFTFCPVHIPQQHMVFESRYPYKDLLQAVEYNTQSPI